MQKLLTVAAAGAFFVTVPQIATAQSQSQSQQPANIQAQVKSNLEQAGFKNVQIMPSSFMVRATDKDGNPVMMVINPDSLTAVTELSADQETARRQSEPLNLTPSQRAELWQNLSTQPKGTPPVGFAPKVGEALPSAIGIKPLPSNVTNQVPALKQDEYAMLQNQLLIVDPSSTKIVDIITP